MEVATAPSVTPYPPDYALLARNQLWSGPRRLNGLFDSANMNLQSME